MPINISYRNPQLTRLFRIAFIFAAILLFPACKETVQAQSTARSEHANGVWAKVNDQILTTLEVKRKLEDVTTEIKRTYKTEEANRRVLIQINQYTKIWVENKLYLAEAKARGLRVTTKQVEDRFEKLVAEKYAGNLAAYEEILERNNSSVAEKKREIKESLLMNSLKDRVTANKVFVKPSDIRKYYAEHPEEFGESERVRGRRIVLREKQNKPDSKQILENRLKPIEAALNSGGNFATLAAKHSELKSEAHRGGEMKAVPRGVMLPEIDEALFNTPVGEYKTLIIDKGSEFLGVILRVEERLPERVAPFEEVREAIFHKIYQANYKQVADAFLAEMREKYVVFEGQP